MMEVENRLKSEYIAISIDNGTKSILSSLEETEVTYDKGDYIPVEGRMLLNGVLSIYRESSIKCHLNRKICRRNIKWSRASTCR